MELLNSYPELGQIKFSYISRNIIILKKFTIQFDVGTQGGGA